MQAIYANAINGLRKVVNNLCMCNAIKKMESCNPIKAKFECVEPPPNPLKGFSFGSAPDFGVGLCDETECTIDVIDIMDMLEAKQLGCTFWQSDPSANVACIVAVRDYSVANSSSLASAPIETIGTELCFVIREQTLRRCEIAEPPFSFDKEAVAVDICVNDKSGEPEPFNDVCSCQFESPMCDMGCCEQYARHINGQVLDQIGARTCGEVASNFQEDQVWCPFVDFTSGTIPALTDYTFAHAWCAYYREVIAPLCMFASPLVRVDDLNVGVPLNTFVTNTCMRTVEQIGVCVPINTTVENLTHEIMQVDIEADEFFAANNAGEFIPGPIVTFPQPGDTAEDIVRRTLDKYYCQQYALDNNNTNIVAASQPWSVEAVTGLWCDNQMSAALNTLWLQREAMFRSRDPSGEYVALDLEGLPNGVAAFGSGVPGAMDVNCAVETGLNIAEISDQQACNMMQSMDANQGLMDSGVSGTDTVSALDENAILVNRVDYVSGLAPPDPSDPDFDDKMREMDSVTMAVEIDTSWQTPDPDTLEPETAPWRRTFPVPAGDDEPDHDFPFHLPFRTNPGGRSTLAFEKGAGAEYWDANELVSGVQDRLNHVFAAVMGHTAPPKMNYAQSAKYRQMLAEKQARRTKRQLQKLMEAYDNSRPDRVAAAGHATTTRRGATESERERAMTRQSEREYNRAQMTMRHLQNTGNDELDSQINDIRKSLTNIPLVAERITPEDFEQFLAEEAAARMDRLADVAEVIVFPMMFEELYGMATDGGDFIFGGSNKAGNPNCRATMNNPYKCCTVNATAYDCCRGLLLCIPLLPDAVFLNRTTVDSVYEWECKHTNSFTETWVNSIRLLTNATVTIFIEESGSASGVLDFFFGWMIWPNDKAPSHVTQCILVHSHYIFIGVLIAWSFWVLLGLQLIAELAIYYQSYLDADEAIASDEATEAEFIRTQKDFLT
jgi:hypothetical protein